MKLSDQAVKWRIVLLVAAFSLIGFILEIGPVGGVFSLANNGPAVATAITLELAALGFVAYLALAASAAVGLHVGDTEPTEKEEPQPSDTPLPVPGDGETQEQVRPRVRPELHQVRMLFTALGGYALLKGISLALLSGFIAHRALTAGQYIRLFQFGFIFTALSWFVLWQFLRWYAQRRRWIRLQDELVGTDVTRVIAVVILLNPLFALITAVSRGTLSSPLGVTVLLLHLTLVAVAAVLWRARPYTQRRTLISLGAVAGVIIVLTILLAVVERTITG